LIAVISLIVVLSLSFLVTRIAAVALVHTGLSRESARFQARSAFTGVGFTTTESESIVDHPVRRRIVMWLMLIGNVGFVTMISSLMLSVFEMERGAGVPPELIALVGGVAAVALIARSSWVERRMASWISWALRRYTRIDARDYAQLLHLRDDYGVAEIVVSAGDWIEGRTLADSALGKEGVLVLGVECAGSRFLGAPAADTALRAGDRLTVYGATRRIGELSQRSAGRTGERAHTEARSENQLRSQQERARAGR